MSAIDNDGGDDDRIAQALSECRPDSVLDDLRFARLARRIDAAGAERLRRARRGQRTMRMQWLGGVVSIGLAASAALALILLHGTFTQQDMASGSTPVASGTVDHVREDRRSLVAASVGAMSEDDFLTNVWGHVDAETLLASDRE